MFLKHAIGALALALLIGTTASSVRAAGAPNCQTVAGKGQWTLIPSADPLGRVLGPTTGSLKASISATLKSLLGSSALSLDQLIYGLLLILFIIYMPKGILGTLLERRAHRTPSLPPPERGRVGEGVKA